VHDFGGPSEFRGGGGLNTPTPLLGTPLVLSTAARIQGTALFCVKVTGLRPFGLLVGKALS